MDAWTVHQTKITNLTLKPKFWVMTCQSYISSVIYISIHTVSGTDNIKRHIEVTSQQSPHAVRSSSSEDDFFSALQLSQAQDGAKQLDGFLACSSDHTDLLKSFPAVCKLSVELNTPLPASAACERLFSFAGLVFSPRRARLNSCNFENQLLLKMNRHLFSFN